MKKRGKIFNEIILIDVLSYIWMRGEITWKRKIRYVWKWLNTYTIHIFYV